MNYDENDYIMFADSIGHIFIGKFVSKTDTHIRVKNPLIISSDKKDEGGMNIEFFPMLFREFQADKNQESIWNVPINTTTWLEKQNFEIRLTSKYEQIFSPIKNVLPLVQPNMQNVSNVPTKPATTAPIIKLFDEKTK